MTSATHVLNLHSDKESPSPPVGGMRSISETLPLHYGREDLVQNNIRRVKVLFVCCPCAGGHYVQLFCVPFSPGSKGNTSGWLSLSPFTHQPVYWPSGLDGSHWAKAAQCNLVFYNPESCWSAAWEKIHPLSYIDVIKQQHSPRLSSLYNSLF